MSKREHSKQYTRLLTLLKRKCKKGRPSVEIVEWAMDKLQLPEDFELDYEELILDLSCFELDAEQEQIRQVERRYAKMAQEATTLESVSSGNWSPEHLVDDTITLENKALIARVEQLMNKA